MTKRLVFLVVGFFLVLGCEHPPEEYEPEPNVFCLMKTGEDSVVVLVGMSARFSDTLQNPGRWNGVTGAAVTVDDIILSEVRDSVGYYVTHAIDVVSSQAYSLEVGFPDGPVVRGRTTVPDSFALTSVEIDTVPNPWSPDTLVRIRATWDTSRNAAGYQLTGFGHYRHPWGFTFDVPSESYGTESCEDSLFFARTGFFDFQGRMYILDLVSVKLAVWAQDTNYSDYLRSNWGMDADASKWMHLEGGLGVFGSACVIESLLPIKPQKVGNRHLFSRFR